MCNGHIKYSVLVSVSPEMQVFVLHSINQKRRWYRCIPTANCNQSRSEEEEDGMKGSGVSAASHRCFSGASGFAGSCQPLASGEASHSNLEATVGLRMARKEKSSE